MTQMMKNPIFKIYLGDDWYPKLKPLVETKEMDDIGIRIMNERGTGANIIPSHENIDLCFRAFRECPPQKLKVVVLGQDPYPQPKVFDGLAFSNGNSMNASPSLRNIFTEVERTEYSNEEPPVRDLDLTRWANQGVLLLNTALTVQAGVPGSHIDLWKPFMQKLLNLISAHTTGLVFMLWGGHAKSYKEFILHPENHHIIEAGHPSPLNTSVPFVGSGVFSIANALIEGMNGKEATIEW